MKLGGRVGKDNNIWGGDGTWICGTSRRCNWAAGWEKI